MNTKIIALNEGKADNDRIQITIDGIKGRGCACCICSPESRGAGDETANQSAVWSGKKGKYYVVEGAVFSEK
jgi:hypothetical protein